MVNVYLGFFPEPTHSPGERSMAFVKRNFFPNLNLFGFVLESMSKTTQKTGPQSIENRGPGAPNPRSGGVPEGFWKVLAPKSASGRVLGGSWARLVGHKRPTWPQFGPQDGAQIESKSRKNGVENPSKSKNIDSERHYSIVHRF